MLESPHSPICLGFPVPRSFGELLARFPISGFCSNLLSNTPSKMLPIITTAARYASPCTHLQASCHRNDRTSANEPSCTRRWKSGGGCSDIPFGLGADTDAVRSHSTGSTSRRRISSPSTWRSPFKCSSTAVLISPSPGYSLGETSLSSTCWRASVPLNSCNDSSTNHFRVLDPPWGATPHRSKKVRISCKLRYSPAEQYPPPLPSPKPQINSARASRVLSSRVFIAFL